jgi:hypothetical protein
MRCLCAGLAAPERGVTSVQAEYNTQGDLAIGVISILGVSISLERRPVLFTSVNVLRSVTSDTRPMSGQSWISSVMTDH